MSESILKSQDFSPCVEQPNKDFEADEITKHLNEYYSKKQAEIDPVILKMAILSLPQDEWVINCSNS